MFVIIMNKLDLKCKQMDMKTTVYDIIIASYCSDRLEEISSELSQVSEIKDLGEPKCFRRLQIKKIEANR